MTVTVATPEERRVLDAMQPYVLLAVSTLLSSSYEKNFSPFVLLQRPHVYRGLVAGGRIVFELPDWLPVEECLLSGGHGELLSFVKHLALRRRADIHAPGKTAHSLELPEGLFSDGDTLSLTYFAWFRYAAPPFDFAAEGCVAHYVGAALLHLCRGHGVTATLDLLDSVSILRLSDALAIEVVGDDALSEMSVLLGTFESSISFDALHLTVSCEMFPDLHFAAREALAAGEAFRGAILSADDHHFLLSADPGVDNVQA